MPNLIIAGASKAGTSSLFSYLAQHPDICASSTKEVAHFLPIRYGESEPPPNAYGPYFRHCAGERYAMEATPGYYLGGAAIATAVNGALPGCRVIIVLREPVERLISYYKFERSHLRLPESMGLAEYVERSLDLHADGSDTLRKNNAFWGLGSGIYVDFLAAWTRTFGDRLLVSYFEDLRDDPQRFVQVVCDWLGVDTMPVSRFDYAVVNETIRYRTRSMQALALRVRRASFYRRESALAMRLKRAYIRLNTRRGDDSPADGEVLGKLRGFYDPHNERLAEMLVRAERLPLPEWLQGYVGTSECVGYP